MLPGMLVLPAGSMPDLGERAPVRPVVSWVATGTFPYVPAPDRMTLDGRKVQMELRLFDRNRLVLGSRGFHWVQEYPFNR